MSQDTKICLCVFASSHGVRGDIKVKAFTEDPRDIVAYGPLQNQDGTREFNLKVIRVLNNNVVLVSCPEIANREEAQTLSGMKLFIDRDKLPALEEEDEFYLEDLTGLKAIDEQQNSLGIIAAVHNFGAGDLLELQKIPNIKGARLIPFTKEAVPAIDLDGGAVTISVAFSPHNEEKDPPAPPKKRK